MNNKPINLHCILLLECDNCLSSCTLFDLLQQVNLSYHNSNLFHSKPNPQGKAARRVRALNNMERKTSAPLKATKHSKKHANPAKFVRSENFAPHSG